MPAKITFTGGAEITVDHDAADVCQRLERRIADGEPFATFKTTDGAEVYVAAGQVACILQPGQPPKYERESWQ